MDNKKGIKSVVTVGIVLNKKGEVLIVRRRHPESLSKGRFLEWVFPGGVQEDNESREERVVKEILLETGYKTNVIRQIHFRIHSDTFVPIIYFLCSLENEEPVQDISEKDEIAEVKWVMPHELFNYFQSDLDPEVRKVLNI